jgi:hypothetical protein
MKGEVSDNGDAVFDRLQQRYRGQHVKVDPQRPELARMAGQVGQIIAINLNGRALVRFEGADQGWHDIDPDYLKLVEKPTTAAKSA